MCDFYAGGVRDQGSSPTQNECTSDRVDLMLEKPRNEINKTSSDTLAQKENV